MIINKNLKQYSQKTILGDLLDSGETILYVYKNILDVGCNDGSQLDVFKKNNFKLDTFGLDALAQFRIKSENFQKYKTYITQEMLKSGFLATSSVYMSVAHNETIFKKYESKLDRIFYKIL